MEHLAKYGIFMGGKEDILMHVRGGYSPISPAAITSASKITADQTASTEKMI